MDTEKYTEMQTYQDISPIVNRCFYIKKSTMPEVYHERVSTCYELEYIPWGEGTVITDGEELPAVAGTLFFRKAGMRVHGILPYASYGILMDDIPVKNLPTVCRFEASHTVGFLFQEIYANYLKDEPLSHLKIKINIMNIIYHMLVYEQSKNQWKQTHAVQYHAGRLKYLTEYMELHLSDHMTLEELAAICNLSPGFLCRLFKQVYNEPIFSWLNRHRVQRAKSLLIETDKPIKDICITCGFNNESYFYRTFKRLTQMSPTSFRKIHRNPFDEITEE